MNWAYALLLLTGFCPIWLAWNSACGTTLRPAVAWGALAWSAWIVFGVWQNTPWADGLAYLALCLTGCAGVAVLGARRPGVGTWNFVVLGLLAAVLRPFAEGLGRLRLESPHLAFLGVVLAVAVGNYLPTRNGLAALALGIGCVCELARLGGVSLPPLLLEGAKFLLALAPWLALGRRHAGSEIDRLWLTYRDRYGFVWGQRAREQFNKAAANAGWPVSLRWGGLRAEPGAPADEKLLALLRGVLKRFSPE